MITDDEVLRLARLDAEHFLARLDLTDDERSLVDDAFVTLVLLASTTALGGLPPGHERPLYVASAILATATHFADRSSYYIHAHQEEEN